MPHRLVLATLVAVSVAALGWAEDDPTAAALALARERYDGEMTRYCLAGREWFDQAEAKARKAGSNGQVEVILRDRATFDDVPTPLGAVPTDIRRKWAAARKAMGAAYEAAVKEYTKDKRDDLARAVGREQAAFLAADPNTAPREGRGYRLLNFQTGLALDVAEGAKGRTGLVQGARSGTASQVWSPRAFKAGLQFVNRHSGKAINVPRGAATSGLQLLQWDAGGGNANELWVLKKREGGFALVSEHGLVIAAEDGTEGGKIVQLTPKGRDNEVWVLVPAGEK